jgi:hypothetical protein
MRDSATLAPSIMPNLQGASLKLYEWIKYDYEFFSNLMQRMGTKSQNVTSWPIPYKSVGFLALSDPGDLHKKLDRV